MPDLTRLLAPLLLLLLAAPAWAQAPASAPKPAAAAATAAAPAAAPVTAQAQARDALAVLQDDKRRAELIATLEAMARAAPPAAAAAAGSAPAAAAAAAPPAPAAAATPIEPDGLGAVLAARLSASLAEAGTQVGNALRSVNDLPLLWRWLALQAADPEARAAIADALWKTAVVLAAAVAGEFAVRRLLRGLRATLVGWAPVAVNADEPEPPGPGDVPGNGPESGLAAAEAGESELHRRRLSRALGALRRLPYLVGRLLLDLVPIVAFAVVGDLLLGTPLGTPEKTRLAALQAIEAYAYVRLILAVAALLVSPAAPRLRLLHVSDWSAAFLSRWTRRIVVIAVVGVALTNIGLLFGMYRTAHDAVLKLFALVVHLCLVAAVLQAREPVSSRLHARLQARPSGIWAVMLRRFAEIWHIVAVFYIVALWLVWAVELRHGFVRLIDFCVVTFAVLLGTRLLGVVLLGGLERTRAALLQGSSRAGIAARAGLYFPFLRTGLVVALWCVAGLALLQAWGFDALGWLASGGLGGRVLSAVLLIGLTVLIAILVWEAANTAIERHLAELADSAQLARAGRLRTLLPLLRSVLLITILLIVALMTLSEVGVNIAPLLAGAGVVGIAVGFGSQKLVQDLITGLFLLLENAMQVGDVVTLAGLSGTVEALTIRTIRLRAVDGAVHLIPFSAVTTVTNQTRDYAYAVLDVSIGLNEAPDPIAALLREVAQGMQADPDWQSMVLDQLEVMGVDKLTDTAWIMRVRIKTQPGSRWTVSRELNRRIKMRFDALAIESPFTSHRVLSRDPPPPPAAVQDEAA